MTIGKASIELDEIRSGPRLSEDLIDLNRELVPSPLSTDHLSVMGDAMRGVGLFQGDLGLFDRVQCHGSASQGVSGGDRWHHATDLVGSRFRS